jgi:hypothetical protein
VILKGPPDNNTGVALVELYDIDRASASRLANISGRSPVEGGRNGENVLIAGFIVGNNDGAARIVVRGLGPSLASAGVKNFVDDPYLEIHDNNGALLLANDNWQSDPAMASQVSAAGLAPANSRESAVAASFLPGTYTAIVSAATGLFGVGLVEVYNLP